MLFDIELNRKEQDRQMVKDNSIANRDEKKKKNNICTVND